MKFLRTASTGRLLAMIAGIAVAIGGGTAIAVAAAGSGPVPPTESLAQAVHDGLSGPALTGVTAQISFTNNLISSGDFTGDKTDPILQGTPNGRLWLSADHRLRLELQTSNGDAELIVDKGSFYVSDPSSNTVYEGTLPAAKAHAKPDSSADHGIPSLAQIQSELNRLMSRVDLSGASPGAAGPTPGNVAGEPAYTVSISPKHAGGMLGSAQLTWDAVRGVPLELGIYATGSSTPVLDLKATGISFGAINRHVFDFTPLPGAKVVKVSTAGHDQTSQSAAAKPGTHTKSVAVSGVAAVAARVPFTLGAPDTLIKLPRHAVKLLDWAGKPAALVTYGENLGGITVIEQSASAAAKPSQSSGDASGTGLGLPTVSINGATGQELSTALGTVVRVTSGGVAYTVIGSVEPFAAEAAARALVPAPTAP